MELKEFLESGLIELHVMGMLAQDDALLVQKMLSIHPEVRREIDLLETFYEQDARRNAVNPSLQLDRKMELLFSNLDTEQHIQLTKLPLITGFSDSNAWLELVSPLLPKNEPSKRFEKLLRYQDGVMQALVVSPTHIDEEIHEELHESFLILKGTCICTIGESSLNMGPGDYMEIPLHQPHTVTITSSSVTAILQRIQLS